MDSSSRVPPSVQPLVARLAAVPGVRRVILYGSRARGDHRARSDVDLALDARDTPRSVWLRLWADAQEADTLYGVDRVRLDEVPGRLLVRIEAERVDV